LIAACSWSRRRITLLVDGGRWDGVAPLGWVYFMKVSECQENEELLLRLRQHRQLLHSAFLMVMMVGFGFLVLLQSRLYVSRTRKIAKIHLHARLKDSFYFQL
jgi:hypothetical protein